MKILQRRKIVLFIVLTIFVTPFVQAQTCTPPSVSISGSSQVCAGVIARLTASGASTYLWNTGATTPSIDVSPGSTTTYTVTGSTGANCSATASKTISVAPSPQ